MQNARYGKLTFLQSRLGTSVSIWLGEFDFEIEVTHGIFSRKPAERFKFPWANLVDVTYDNTTITLYPLEYAPITFKAPRPDHIVSSIKSVQELCVVRRELGLSSKEEN